MIRRHISFSLILPMATAVVVSALAAGLLTGYASSWEELRAGSAAVIGLIAGSAVIFYYWLVRRRILSPLRELQSKLTRARHHKLEPAALPPHRDEIRDVIEGYNQMVQALKDEQEKRAQLERRRRLEEHLNVLGPMAVGLAHELASPLAALANQAALMGDAPAAVKMRSELSELTSRLRQFMAIFRQERRADMGPVSLEQAIDAAMCKLNDPSVCRVAPDADKTLCVWADATLLGEILDNLFQNAARHARTGFSVRVSREDGGAAVDVVDDGRGIEAAAAEKIFRPFYTTAPSGTGLGLFVALLWARSMGGDLALKSAHDPKSGGAHFRLTIPSKE